jgi:hypothetical protein
MSVPKYSVVKIGLLGFLLTSHVAMAVEPVSYGEGVIGPQKHATQLTALGNNLFGEEINTYTGGISFSQTDLSLPGNDSLPVNVTRRLIVDGNKSRSYINDDNLWRGYLFGEWELDLPYLTGTYSDAQGWVVNTASPNARCSSPTTYNQFRPKDVTLQAYVTFYSYNFWNGISLNVPGSGEDQLLYRAAGGSLPMPTGSWTALTTQDQWHFSCLSSLQSGQAGEGFLGLAPDGTRYKFDWMVKYVERPQHGEVFVQQVFQSRPTRVQADLTLSTYRLYPTRIEDRFGNYVTYTWSGSNLTAITASDGRSITFTYTNGRITSATAGVQTVQYGYVDGLLTSVTLPDNSSWGFATSTVVNLPRFVPLLGLGQVHDYPMTCQLMRQLAGVEADLTMTHPSGAQGVFRLGYNRLYRSGLTNPNAGLCPESSMPDGVAVTWRDRQPYVPVRYDVLALKRKTLSGPGMPAAQVWQFQHQDNYQWAGFASYPTLGTRTVTTTAPDGNTVVDVFGTDALVNEGQLLSNEVRQGATVLSRQENTYVQTSQMASMPFPDWMGQPLAYDFIRGRGDYNRPLKTSVIKQQGVSFTRNIDVFDVLARPTQITRSSAPSP